ncbi:MAG: hypothetical protein GYA24_00320 [Candidatus Lokiarchaeota archaeon]|nr:hypothetical protein [Candidatus Lokiarchaeota archaeon]
MIYEYVTFTSTDWYMRIANMALLTWFAIYTIVLARRASAAGIATKKNYFISFSLFFLFWLVNFIQVELWLIFDKPSGYYIDTIPGNSFQLPGILSFINATDDNIYMFLFYYLGAVPLIFAVERFLMLHKKVPLTVVAIVGLAANLFIFFVPGNEIVSITVILIDYLGMIITVLTILIIYLRIAVISSGSLRAVGLLMFFGLLLQVPSVILSSTWEWAHLLGVIGFLLVFISITQMK